MLELEPGLKRKAAWAKNAFVDREIARLAMDCLDLTSLKGNESTADIHELANKAIHNRLASVCIYPPYIEAARSVIRERNVTVATVINFPFGRKRSLSDEDATPETTAEDVSKAITAGAGQIDIVLDYGAFRQGNTQHVASLLQACRDACPKDITMKVILETASFDSVDDLREACRMAVKYGADCLKTSTGFHEKGGATLEAAAILLEEAKGAPREIGIKISGGVKTAEDCAQYMILARSIVGWSAIRPDRFRIGASGVLNSLLEVLESSTSKASHEYQHLNPFY